MSQFVDYYAVLGVPSHASEEEIKRAFRVLARRHHPDCNPVPDAEARFIKIHDAYKVLSDPDKRREFDQLFAQHTSEPTDNSRPRPPSPSQQPSAPGDIPLRSKPGQIYIILDLGSRDAAQFVLNGTTYRLTSDEVRILKRDGMLRGRVADQSEYLLMYCVRCHALFVSKQVRDKSDILYDPYYLFPVCPHCKVVDWCPADDAREERERAAQAERERRERTAQLEREQRERAAQAERERCERERLEIWKEQQKRAAKKRAALLVGLILLLIGGSLGLFAFTKNRIATDNAHATATAQAYATAKAEASSTAIAVTAQANKTATVQANKTVTVEANKTATAVASRNPNPSFTNLALDDPLKDNSKGYGWDETACIFYGGAYNGSSSPLNPCPAATTNFGNFVYQVQVKITSGDCGGILFRVHPSDDFSGDFDQFIICQDQSYALAIHKAGVTSAYDVNVSAIHGGLNQSNYVAIEAQGSTLKLYINQQFITTVTDNNTSPGQIGVIAEDLYGGYTTVTFSNADVWTR